MFKGGPKHAHLDLKKKDNHLIFRKSLIPSSDASQTCPLHKSAGLHKAIQKI